MPDSLAQQKSDLRDFAKRRREAAALAARGAAAGLAERFLAAIAVPPGAAVSGYWPLGLEMDVRPILRELARRGHPIGLPVVLRRGAPLLFRAWTEATALETAGLGIQVPGAGAPEVTPEVLLVPLLAFDRAGYRLGYGGGFYDRTLARLRAGAPAGRPTLAVGVGYAGQELPAVPHDETDARLDWVVTESEAIAIAAPKA